MSFPPYAKSEILANGPLRRFYGGKDIYFLSERPIVVFRNIKREKTMNGLIAAIALVFIGCVIASNNS